MALFCVQSPHPGINRSGTRHEFICTDIEVRAVTAGIKRAIIRSGVTFKIHGEPAHVAASINARRGGLQMKIAIGRVSQLGIAGYVLCSSANPILNATVRRRGAIRKLST
jgi:hypothetical protein